MEQATAKIWIQAGGYFHLALALFHLMFWRLFRWHEQLARLHPVNRAVMQVLNLRLTYVFIVFAVLSLVYTDAMLSVGLGQVLCAAIALFWVMRALEQLVFFSMHLFSWLMFFIFLGGAALYAWPLFATLGFPVSL